MQENQFFSIFETAANEAMGENAFVQSKANLRYELFLDRRLSPPLAEDTQKPRRGQSAFQTDICVFEKIEGLLFPRVAIEFKPNVTTHDILTYSTKAGKHKNIYPCLRYGLLASELSVIPHRFFVHNEHLDFFIAAKEYTGELELKPFVEKLIRKELEISRELERIHFGDKRVDYYRTQIIFDKFRDLA